MLAWVVFSALLVSPQSGDAPACAPEVDAVEHWVTILDSPACSESARSEAREKLRVSAAGRPSEPATREALFALVRAIPQPDPVRDEADVKLLWAAATLFADDPRVTPVMTRLVRAQLERSDRYGAHFTLTRLSARDDAPWDAELWTVAATNAMVVGDTPAALDWTDRVDAASIPGGLLADFWLTRLVAAEALGRYDRALEASERLETLAPDDLRRHARALLAAARTDAAVGRVSSADMRYQAFVNIHSDSVDRAAALLEHAKLLLGMQRYASAQRAFQWILSEHSASDVADVARIEQLEVDPHSTTDDRVDALREAASAAVTQAGAGAAADRLLELLIAEGRPLEAISTLVWIARNGEGLAPLAARASLVRGLEPAMRLLAARDDDVGLAAAALAARSMALPLPLMLRDKVAVAIRRLGMTVSPSALDDARGFVRDGRWDRVRPTLARIADPTALDPDSRARFAGLAAEALWRDGQDDDAIEQIDEVLEPLELPPYAERPLRVLRADILYAKGENVRACAEYRSATGVGRSEWVDAQLSRCNASLDTETRP